MTAATTQAQDAASSFDLRPGRGVSRVAVLLVVGCVGVHLAGAAQHWSMTPFWSAAMLVASAACLVCVPHLWSAPTVRSWVGAVVGFALMFTLHLMMLVQMSSAGRAGGSSGHDGHAVAVAVTGPGLDPVTAAGLLLPALGIAWSWWVLGRAQRRSVWPTPASA